MIVRLVAQSYDQRRWLRRSGNSLRHEQYSLPGQSLKSKYFFFCLFLVCFSYDLPPLSFSTIRCSVFICFFLSSYLHSLPNIIHLYLIPSLIKFRSCSICFAFFSPFVSCFSQFCILLTHNKGDTLDSIIQSISKKSKLRPELIVFHRLTITSISFYYIVLFCCN